MSRVPAYAVFKSKAQQLLKQISEENFSTQESNQNIIASLDELVDYAKSKGELTDSYSVIVEIIQKVLFNEEEIEGEEEFPVIIKTEDFLLEVLNNDNFNVKEATKHFSFEFNVFILKLFQRRCSGINQPQIKQRWKTILHKFYSLFFIYRNYIYSTVISYFDFVSMKSSNPSVLSQINKKCKTEKEEIIMLKPYYSTAELLEVVGSIIAGFVIPLREEHTSTLLPSLLRLHRNIVLRDDENATIQIYHKQLTYCISQFLEKSGKFIGPKDEQPLLISVIKNLIETINGLSRYGNSKQIVFLLNEIEQLMENISLPSFLFLRTLFFQLLNSCIGNLNFSIAQRSMLMLLNNQKILKLSLDNRTMSFDGQIVPLLIKTAKEHWNDSSRQMSYQLLRKIDQNSPPNKKLTNNSDFKQLGQQWAEKEQEIKSLEIKKRKNMSKKKDDRNFTILDFVYVKELGAGSYSQVHQVRLIDSNVSQLYWEDYALKSMVKSHIISQNYLKNIEQEKSLLNLFFSHPLIIRLLTEFEDDDKYYLLLEYTPKGDLFHLIEKFGTFNFEYAQFVIAEVCVALQFIHSKNVVFGDLKPENLLSFPSGHIKLTDFASAYVIPSNEDNDNDNVEMDDDKNEVVAGTMEYLSPALLNGSRSKLSFFDDVWALGCLIYQLFIGKLPFEGTDKQQVLNKIEKQIIYPPTVPPKAKELIDLIFSHKIDENISIEDVKNHPFFDGIQWANLTKTKPPKPNVGEVKVSALDLGLRQRKHSMLLTQSLPSAYSYATFALPPIPEDEPEDDSILDN